LRARRSPISVATPRSISLWLSTQFVLGRCRGFWTVRMQSEECVTQASRVFLLRRSPGRHSGQSVIESQGPCESSLQIRSIIGSADPSHHRQDLSKPYEYARVPGVYRGVLVSGATQGWSVGLSVRWHGINPALVWQIVRALLRTCLRVQLPSTSSSARMFGWHLASVNPDSCRRVNVAVHRK
jgi:hypothetical protein